MFLVVSTSPVFAWIDPAWPFRRPIDVDWVADRATGDELIYADLYTGGTHQPDGSDLRVATADDKLLRTRVLTVGPGDRIRIAFPAVKGVSRYYAYFGHPKPPPLEPAMADIPRSAGLLMEMRELTQADINNAAELEKAWNAAEKVIGRTLIPHASLGVNPFGEQQRTISRFEGTFPVGFDGDYFFALSADDRAAVFIDGKPVIFTDAAIGDVRNNAAVRLSAGKRSLVIYHANLAGDGRFAVAFRRAETQRWQALSSDVLGKPLWGKAGALERPEQALIADFAVAYQGECFFAGGYSHRYQFTANPPRQGVAANYEWDFGNGQTATGPAATQVYLADGVYPVKLVVRDGTRSDTRTQRIAVSRDWEWTDRPTEEPLERHALVVAGYRADRLPPTWLPRAALLFVRAGKLDQALSAAAAGAAARVPADAGQVMTALTEAADAAVEAGRLPDAVKLWRLTPADSLLQPGPAKALALLQLWRQGDADGAAKTLAQLPMDDPDLKRALGQALVLSGKRAEGAKLLESLPMEDDPARRAAISGASARTVEFYIATKDADAGENAWAVWQQRLPTDFLQGHAVMLKVRLLELRKSNAAAANIAEAFARAVPDSPYSPPLLDRASRLIGEADLARSLSLRKLLKERYPEDPLSQ
ncbi:PKD domain-containing protein [Humisphaera borealis]|uniref:PKD domain-containing protein n=1 Tax=Humisphaera borealis TaxID=2807512 RepID=UPI0019D1DE01|nr:PKD domain-containing protein [Humisphaera borealis]